MDRRFGTQAGIPPERWFHIRRGAEYYNWDYSGSGNTFSFVDAFGEVMAAPLQAGVDFSQLKDYDLLYLRVRDHDCAKAVKELRKQCPEPVIISYSDELANARMPDKSHNPTPLWRYYGEWLPVVAKNSDRLVSSFPDKYDRPKHEALGITNWESCPFAGDIYGWSKYREMNIEKKNVISGMFHLRSYMEGGYGDRKHSMTLNAMRKIQNRHGVECWFFLNFDGHKVLPILKDYASRIGLEVKFIEHQPNNVFETMMAQSKVFIEEHLDPCFSRASEVACGVGTPQVGCDLNTVSNICFPETTVELGQWDKLAGLVSRLLTDKDFYEHVRESSLELGMDNLYYPAFRDRMIKLYNKCLSER